MAKSAIEAAQQMDALRAQPSQGAFANSAQWTFVALEGEHGKVEQGLTLNLPAHKTAIFNPDKEVFSYDKVAEYVYQGFTVVITGGPELTPTLPKQPHRATTQHDENPGKEYLIGPEYRSLYFRLRTALRHAVLRIDSSKDTTGIVEELRKTSDLAQATNALEALLRALPTKDDTDHSKSIEAVQHALEALHTETRNLRNELQRREGMKQPERKTLAEWAALTDAERERVEVSRRPATEDEKQAADFKAMMAGEKGEKRLWDDMLQEAYKINERKGVWRLRE